MTGYIITNLVNGKRYIGKTVQSLAARWRGHLASVRRGSSCYLRHAIRKYNVTDGGEGASGCVRSEQTREKYRIVTQKRMMSLTPEQRSAIGRKAAAALTPEQQSKRMRKWNAGLTPEQRRETGRTLLHARRHLKRGIVNPVCSSCIA
jgi:GIY-YIG catalytic domain